MQEELIALPKETTHTLLQEKIMVTPNQNRHIPLSLVHNDEKQTDVTLAGELDLEKYIDSVPADVRTLQAVYAWRVLRREKMAEKVLQWLTTTFAGTVAAFFVFGALAFFNPDSKNEFLIKTAPDIVKIEAALVGTVFGTYSLSSKYLKDKQEQ